MTWYRIRLDLLETSPEIWRELLVPAELPLPELHLLLQAAMGWENSHLHSFARGPQTHWQSRPHWVMDVVGNMLEGDESDLPESRATVATLLSTPGDQATYLYDFGDDWEHLLTLGEVLDGGASAVVDLASGVLTDGAGMCPPEDAGGIPGHATLLEHVAALGRGEQLEQWPEEVVRWAFGTLDVEQIRAVSTFDLARQQATVAAIGQAVPMLHPLLEEMLAEHQVSGLGSLRAMVQAADLDAEAPLTDAAHLTENLRWFLDLVGDSLTLTGAGYLRPVVVEQVAQQLRLEREWIGARNREDQTPGVVDFRALVVSLGLVRTYKGKLLLTKAGAALRAEPERLLTHIADRLPLGRDPFIHQAGLLVMLGLLAKSEERLDTFGWCAAILNGQGWRSGTQEVDGWDVRDAARETIALLTRCGILEEGERTHRWEATPAGAAFLRRVLRGGPVTT